MLVPEQAYPCFPHGVGNMCGVRTATGAGMGMQAGTGMQARTVLGMQVEMGMQAGTVSGMQAGTGMQTGVNTLQPAAFSLPASRSRAKPAGTAPLCWQPRRQLVQVHIPGQAAMLSPSCCGLSPCPAAIACRAGASG